MMQTGSGTNKKSKGLTKLVLSQVRPYRKWLVLIFLAMLVETLMGLAAPWPLKIIIDNVIDNHPLPAWLGWLNYSPEETGKMGLAVGAAVLLVLLTLLGSVAGYVNSYFTESVAQYVANDVRLQVYHHLQRLSLSYYDKHQVSKIMSTLTTDILTVQDFVSTALLRILIDAMTIAGILGLMFYLNWDFALIALGVTPFLVYFTSRFKKAVKKSVHEVRVDQTNMAAVLQQGLESIRVINAFGSQQMEEQRLKAASLITVNAALKTRRLKSLLSPIINILVTICIALVLWRGASLILAGLMTIGALTVFLSYLNKFFSPVKDLAKMTNSVAHATVALERIQNILEADAIVRQKPDALKATNVKGDIDFENVSFAYTAESVTLQNINVSIKAGQRIGICGPTGSGKSTIASLIPRFYDPATGVIKIDGVDVASYELDGIRKQIGFVLQDTVLFFGSIKDNIAYGKPDATDEEIIAAAKKANADEFIDAMPHGYDTLVGEKGLTLSGGQRQRIGIARAIIRNAPILILDEPTAALDPESEKTVMDALEKLMEGRTVMTITHRLNTIRHMDKILVIDSGTLAEEGTHEELIAKEGLYAELCNIQSVGNKANHSPGNEN